MEISLLRAFSNTFEVLAKPSIFSRDYERKIKKKKRRITIAIIACIVAVVVIICKVQFSNLDFSTLRERVQAWVDSDNPNKNQVEEEIEKEEEEEEEIPKELSLALTMPNGSVIKGIYKEEDGSKHFTEIQGAEDMTYNFNKSMEKVLIIDSNQNMKVFSIDGTSIDITKRSYTSQNGGVYNKEDILAKYQGFIWSQQGKFIDDNQIVFISNLPYIGNGIVDKYVWIKNIQNNNEYPIYTLVGITLEIGELDDVNGIKVIANNVSYFLKADGTVINESDTMNKQNSQPQNITPPVETPVEPPVEPPVETPVEPEVPPVPVEPEVPVEPVEPPVVP